MRGSAAESQPGTPPIAYATRLTKKFNTVTALNEVAVGFKRGAFTSIMGPSGSGKTTLLQCLAGLEVPSSGQVVINNRHLTGLSPHALTELRRDHLGFVFQSYKLVPTLTAMENVTLGERIGGPKLNRQWLNQLIDRLGLSTRLEHRPNELSGGQQQRVAIARALVHRPAIVFADEPTGNLDSRTGSEVLTFLREAAGTFGQTIVMVTHDPMAAAHTDRVLFLRDGRIVDDLGRPTSEAVLARLGALEAIK